MGSPNSVFFSDISASVAQNKKIQKTRSIYFLILLLAGLSSPSQLVPNPFNWSPNSVFFRYLSIGRSNQKKSKNNIHLFLNFASCRTLFTKSTGPQPIQLVPNSFSYRYLGIGRSIKKNQKTISIYF